MNKNTPELQCKGACQIKKVIEKSDFDTNKKPSKDTLLTFELFYEDDFYEGTKQSLQKLSKPSFHFLYIVLTKQGQVQSQPPEVLNS